MKKCLVLIHPHCLIFIMGIWLIFSHLWISSLKVSLKQIQKIKNKATDMREPVAYECFNSRRFYLTGSLTNCYSFIRGSLKWPFCELFVSDVSLWNQYKFIAFNIFTCIIFIIYCITLIITVISNEKTSELTI